MQSTTDGRERRRSGREENVGESKLAALVGGGGARSQRSEGHTPVLLLWNHNELLWQRVGNGE